MPVAAAAAAAGQGPGGAEAAARSCALGAAAGGAAAAAGGAAAAAGGGPGCPRRGSIEPQRLLARRMRLAQEVVRRRRQPVFGDCSTFSALHIDNVAALPSGAMHLWSCDLGRRGAARRQPLGAAAVAAMGRVAAPVEVGDRASARDAEAPAGPAAEAASGPAAEESEAEKGEGAGGAEDEEASTAAGAEEAAEAREGSAGEGCSEGRDRLSEEEQGEQRAEELPQEAPATAGAEKAPTSTPGASSEGSCAEQEEEQGEQRAEELPQEAPATAGAEKAPTSTPGASSEGSCAEQVSGGVLGAFFRPKGKRRPGQPKPRGASEPEAGGPEEPAEAAAPAAPSGAGFAATRDGLLRWRAAAAAEGAPPAELASLAAGEAAPAPAAPRAAKVLEPPPGSFLEPPPGTFVRHATQEACRATVSLPLASDLSWRRTASAPLPRTAVPVPADELRGRVQSLLNKVCPENIAQIVTKLSSVQVSSCEQLETIIELIFKKALAEPHYCETYADLVFGLKAVFPEFPGPSGGKPLTFKSAVLNICQGEFEALLLEPEPPNKAAADPEELEFLRKQRRDRMRANMKFVGHLFLRQLLSVKVIGSVVCELVSCYDPSVLPEEHAVECAIELCLAVGYTLEALPVGQSVLGQVCGRLLELKGQKTEKGRGAYCRRVQFQILDLLETRAAGWSKKSFKTSAKTKDEIRQEQGADTAEHVIAGMRPGYISPVCGA